MKILPLLLSLALLLGPVVVAQAGDASGDLAIVVHKASPLDDVSSADLAKFFKAEKGKMPDGAKVVIVMQEPGRPERAAALKFIYRMDEAEYANHFAEATFTGAVASAPKALPSGSAVKKFVAGAPGGLGYVRGSELDDSVKTLRIDGRSPGDADYKLKIN